MCMAVGGSHTCEKLPSGRGAWRVDSGAATASASRGPAENCVMWGGGGGWNSEGGCFVFS